MSQSPTEHNTPHKPAHKPPHKPRAKTRDAFRHFVACDTRWRDNDRYGHLNNAIYYELFDSAINQLLLENDLLDFASGAHVFLVASSGCDYFSELAYPQKLEVGLAITRLGNSSVTYDLGLFKQGANTAAANGFFVHVHVARDGYRPSPITDKGRAVFGNLLVTNSPA
ncbi:MAG: acyl-CoA thioesterase [Candidatus Puniceispirillaceae bacterium]